MENCRDTRIAAEEIAAQFRYMEQMKEQNQEELLRHGRQKLAYLQSFGCQMNENDSEKLSGMLETMGYGIADRPEDSDLILFNTCCVRETPS